LKRRGLGYNQVLRLKFPRSSELGQLDWLMISSGISRQSLGIDRRNHRLPGLHDDAPFGSAHSE
jgi:hypothetical protein